MIIKEETSRPIDRIAISDEKSFNIKTSAKSFKLLSRTIYPDVIAAPIRELATNAMDSHTEAGTTEPFLVHLPNELEPYFSIRDYGTGMTQEVIDTVYCTYFESSRTNSNNYTGAFGLGSKTPLCYGDTFNMTSFKDGVKYIYTAFLEDGIPKMAKFAELPTDERNGVEVSFPVKSSDFSLFFEKAKRIYSRFTVKPIITGNSFDFVPEKYKFVGNKWKILDAATTLRVIMGNITYPVDTYKAGISSHPMSRVGLEIEIDVGELQPTVSREEIQYDHDSCQKIKEKLNSIHVEFISMIRDKLNACKDYYQAAILLNDGAFLGVCNEVIRGVKFHYNDIELVNGAIPYQRILNKYASQKTITEIEKNAMIGNIAYATQISSVVGYTQKKLTSENFSFFYYKSDNRYVILDEKDSGLHKNKLKKYILDNFLKNVYVLNKVEFPEVVDFVVTELKIPSDLLVPISTLPIKPRAKRTVNVNHSSPVKKNKNEKVLSVLTDYSYLESKIIDVSVGEYLYLKTYFGEVITPIGHLSLRSVLGSIEQYKNITGKTPTIVVFDSKKNILNPPSNWKCFYQALNEEFDSFNKTSNLQNINDLNSILVDNHIFSEIADCVEQKNIPEEIFELHKINDDIRKAIAVVTEKTKKISPCYLKQVKFNEVEKEFKDSAIKRKELISKYPILNVLYVLFKNKQSIEKSVYTNTVNAIISSIKK